MTTVRNRKTNEISTKTLSGIVATSSFFNKDSKFDDEITNFLTAIERDMAEEGIEPLQRKEILKQLRDECRNQKSQIQKIMADPEKYLKQLGQDLENKNVNIEQKAEKINAKQTDSSFIGFMTRLLLSTQVSAYLPFAVTAALSALPIAAAQSGIQTHNGQPSGGSDLCSSTLVYGCAQGYLTNGTQAWTSTMPQYNRVVTKMMDKASDGAYFQLRDCMSLDKVAGFASDGYQKGVGAKGVCVAESSIWQGWQLSSQVTSFPQDQCPNYQNNFIAGSKNCMSALGAFLKGAEVAGIVIGSVVGLALIVYGVYYLKERGRCNSCDAPRCCSV